MDSGNWHPKGLKRYVSWQEKTSLELGLEIDVIFEGARQIQEEDCLSFLSLRVTVDIRVTITYEDKTQHQLFCSRRRINDDSCKIRTPYEQSFL
jgi:hypothetical protein